MRNWVIGAAIVAGVVGFNYVRQADRDESGAIVGEGSIDAFQMRVGDCFDDGSTFADDGAEVNSVPGVPCSNPHDNEVYAVFDVESATFPGDEIESMAFESCKQRFHSFVGRDYDSSALDIATLYPTRESWDEHNDREVICAVYDVAANKLTGSMKGRAL
jgi:hypothetical protein